MTNPIADPLVENVIAEDIADLVRLEGSPDGVVVITINRPHRRNAFDAQTVGALREAFETLHGADHVRIVFLRGEGGTFCAGLDLDWMKVAADWSEADNREDALSLAAMFKALHDIPALTVALVEGAAYGAGAGLVAACDMAVAATDARFAFSEVKLGLIPAVISPYVVAAIGPRAARGLFATGRNFGADHALAIGLVNEVVEGLEGMMGAQEALASEALDNAATAMTEAKSLVDEVAGRPIDKDLMEHLAKALARRRVSEEGQEGVRAFLEKRKPAWRQG